MAAPGKKSKKAKWVKANITDIIAEPTTIPTAKSSNWADSVDEEPESFSYASRSRAVVTLPSASRAARGGLAVDDESIPRHPPYTAHISNLPYDIEDHAIMELFAGLKITGLRIPRDGDRLKGFGCVDFEEREGLISAMNMSDLTVGGRRIRIEVSTQDSERRMGRGNRSDRDREYDPERTSGDWRSGPRAMPDSSRPRNAERERDRDRERDRERDSSTDNRPGAWRDGDRPAPPEPARTPYGGRDSFGRDRGFGGEGRDRGFGGRDNERSGYGGRDGFRTADREGAGGFGRREDSRGFGGRGFGDRDRDRDRDGAPREDAKPRERPKLNLLPRTVPRETEVPTKPADGAELDDKPADKQATKPASTKPVSAEKVFGAAKPVDTAAKEREIEERLRKQEEEARRGTDEKERWGRRANDHSSERKTGAIKRVPDDRGRDSRSYNRDRRDRDYSKDDKDRRDYRDDRDRRERDDSRYDRDRRDFSGDRRDRRDYPSDRRPRRDNSHDRRERRDSSGEKRDRRDSREEKDHRDGSRDRRPTSRDRRPSSRDRRPSSRDRRPSSRDRRPTSRDRRTSSRDRRPTSREGRPPSRDRRPTSRDSSPRRRDDQSAPRDERNGRERSSRSRDRQDEDYDEKPLPKMQEQEKPNFVGSNKFSFLEDADDGGSD